MLAAPRALGHFADHDIVDCCGLATPEIIPYLRRPQAEAKRLRMFDYGRRALEHREVVQPGYVVAFNGWLLHALLERSPEALRRVHGARLETLDAMNREPMVVELDINRVRWQRAGRPRDVGEAARTP